MAADWIKMRVDLIDDPAVILIARETEVDVHGVIGRLYRIWGWADRHTSDGRIRGLPPEWLDEYISTAGFAAAMIQAGWLAKTRNGFRFPNFDRHNGQSAKRRALDAARKAVERASAKRPDSCGQNSDRTRTREEKSREETREEKSASTARTSSPISDDYARTGGLGGDGACRKGASQQGACDACPSPAEAGPGSTTVDLQNLPAWTKGDREHYINRLLRAVDIVQKSKVSPRRKPEVIQGVKRIALHKDPVPIVSAINKRAAKRKVANQGGYLAKSILDEANELQESTL